MFLLIAIMKRSVAISFSLGPQTSGQMVAPSRSGCVLREWASQSSPSSCGNLWFRISAQILLEKGAWSLNITKYQTELCCCCWGRFWKSGGQEEKDQRWKQKFLSVPGVELTAASARIQPVFGDRAVRSASCRRTERCPPAAALAFGADRQRTGLVC